MTTKIDTTIQAKLLALLENAQKNDHAMLHKLVDKMNATVTAPVTSASASTAAPVPFWKKKAAAAKTAKTTKPSMFEGKIGVYNTEAGVTAYVDGNAITAKSLAELEKKLPKGHAPLLFAQSIKSLPWDKTTLPAGAEVLPPTKPAVKGKKTAKPATKKAEPDELDA